MTQIRSKRSDGLWQRVLNHARQNTATGCLEWFGSKSGDGYGRMGIGNRKSDGPHRVSWQHWNGPIPEGMCVCHRCDNPSCAEPSHLFLGTKKDNSVDMVKKNRSAKREQNGRSKLKTKDVILIRSLVGTRSLRSIAREYGVHHVTIMDAISGVNWNSVNSQKPPGK